MALSVKFKIVLCMLVLLFTVSAAAMAADINYTNDDNVPLQETPAWYLKHSDKALFPGTTLNPEAVDNSVKVNYAFGWGPENPDIVFGGLSNSGNAQNNTVTIINGWVDIVYGAYLAGEAGSANENIVEISGNSVRNNAYGAYLTGVTGNAGLNSLKLSNGEIQGNAYGAYLAGATGDATHNIVTIDDTWVYQNVYGAYLSGVNGNAANNAVNLSGINTYSKVYGNTYGAYLINGTKGNAAYNTVSITGNDNDWEEYGDSAYGAYLEGVTGNAVSNAVSITKKSTLWNNAYGAYLDDVNGYADSNRVEISDGGVDGDVYGAYLDWGTTGSANSNSVGISSGGVGGDVYGAYLDWETTGDANHNLVEIANSEIGGDVYGAYLDWGTTGDANHNNVVIANSEIDGDVYGALLINNAKGNATDNVVKIVVDSVIDGYNGSVYGALLGGGFSDQANNNSVTITGNVSNNSVNLSSESSLGNISGAALIAYASDEASRNTTTFTGDAANNTVNIYNGDAREIFGAYFSGRINDDASYNTINITGDATNNTVNIYGGRAGEVFGAYFSGSNNNPYDNSIAITGDAINNTVNIAGGNAEIVFGAYLGDGFNIRGNSSSSTITITGNARNNAVNISDDSSVNMVFGAYLNNVTSNATNNTVNIAGGSAGVVFGGYLSHVTGNATGNSVIITNGQVSGNVYGAHLKQSSGDATGNRVEISGGQVNSNVYGADLYQNNISVIPILNNDNINNKTHGAHFPKVTGNATGNSVIITNGQVSGNVYGAHLYQSIIGLVIIPNDDNVNDKIHDTHLFNVTGNAYDNSVEISGGEVKGSVYGAYLSVLIPFFSISDSDTAGNDIIVNNVEIQNNAVHIWGAPDLSAAQLYGTNLASWATDGNTLFVDDYRGAEVNAVGHFQNYRFNIGDNVTDTDAALVVTNTVNLTGANAKIIGLAKNAPLTAGDELMLIDNTNKGELTSYSSTLAKGLARIYHFEYYYKDFTPPEGNDGPYAHLMARIVGANANPTTKSLSEGFLAGAVFLNQKNDLISNRGLFVMGQALTNHPNAQVVPFAAIQGGGSVYKTGSSLNVKGFSGLAGLAFKAAENLSLGVFFEGGWGNYSTRNSFNNFPNVKGDGGTRYYGGGVMARKNNIWRGLYAQGYFSIGRSEVDFRTSDLFNDVGQRAEHDASSTYYSAHAGLGYLLDLSENAEADIYARYLWNRMDRDKVTVGYEPVRFKAVDSHRLQLGVRAHYDLVPGFTPYAGAAWEYEFGGKAKASIDGMNIDAPSVRGATGIGELGFTIRPALDAPLYIEAGVQGYMGKREGVTGTLRISLTF